MSFIDTRFSHRVLSGFSGGPRWNTLRKELMSGRNRRKKLWAMPRFEFIADYAAFTQAEQEEIYNAFIVAGGSFSAFRFKDWNDYRAQSESLGTGDGTSDPIQLVKTYVFGAAEYVRDITLPLNAVVTADGTPITVTVDPLTGLATPAAPWPVGQALAWSGQFDVRVTFAEDFNPFTAITTNLSECRVSLIEDWL